MASSAPAQAADSPPPKHPGERLATFYDNFFKTITAVATLGASLTFAKVVQTPIEPWVDYGFNTDTIQTWICLAWLFFVLALFFTSFASSALQLYRPEAVVWFGRTDSHERRVVAWYATAVTFVLLGFIITAFIFLSLVVAAYSGPTGFTAVGFTAFFGAGAIIIIVWQSPIGSPPPPGPGEPKKPSRWGRSDGTVIRRRPGGDSYTHRPKRTQSYMSGDSGYSGEQDRYVFSEEKMDAYVREDGAEYAYEDEEVFIETPERKTSRYRDTTPLTGRNASAAYESPVQVPRPSFGTVPDYTSDLRRMRVIGASDEYRKRYSQQ